MYAIIETGGKQYRVTEGDTLFIEKLPNEAGDKITFDQVLAILDGDKATFGTPAVAGASVSAEVVKNGKGKKVRIFKYNPKKGYRKRQGHRQPYTKVTLCRRHLRRPSDRMCPQRHSRSGSVGEGQGGIRPP